MKIKIVVLICLFFALEVDCRKKPKMEVNHQGRFFLRNINEARKILASGVIRQLTSLGLESLVGKSNIPPVGPAANMYRMKWSVELESIAINSVKTLGPKPYGNFRKDRHVGFYFLNNIVETVRTFLSEHAIGKHVPFNVIEQHLKKFANALETLFFLVWAILTYPKETTIPPGAEIGPSEALFAHRYEIGCTFDTYALCILKEGRSNGTLFIEGVACTQCPTHCEFNENIDGTIDEGDLCVPPTPGQLGDGDETMTNFDEMQAVIDTCSPLLKLPIIITFLSIINILVS